MKLDVRNMQRRYTDFRLGFTAISPFIALANLIMLVFLTLDNMTLMPIIIIALIITFVIAGKLFRTLQLKIDNNLNYEQQIDAIITTRLIYDDLHKIQEHLGIPISKESLNRRNYFFKIEGANKI